ncbi:hypothetical protein C8R47DRAFT_1039308 [Mycena vitilis]|nr:hypothetical protein C8R47DRAFT_1039308 [Mycena vitilis]
MVHSLLLSLFFCVLPVFCSDVEIRHHGNSTQTGSGLTPNYRVLVTLHALLSALGFAVCLPAGAILARYLRTFRPWWYTGHWIAQVAIAGPIITVGVALGYTASGQYGKTPGDTHKNLGSAIFYVYYAQCAFGAIIHYFKPKSAARRRPIQNYAHAVVGLLIIVLALYQIHTGYAEEWPKMGLGSLAGVDSLWIFWVLLVVLAYLVGLWFLGKQYAQEAAARQGDSATRGSRFGMAALEGQTQRVPGTAKF